MDTLQFKIKETLERTCIKFTNDIFGKGALELKQLLKKYVKKDKELKLDLTDVKEINLTALNSILISNAYANSNENKVSLLVKNESKILDHLRTINMLDKFNIQIAS